MTRHEPFPPVFSLVLRSVNEVRSWKYGVRHLLAKTISTGFSNHFQRNMSSIAIKTDRVSVLTEGNINPNVKAMEYAVRGPLVIRAVEIEKELASVCIALNFSPVCKLVLSSRFPYLPLSYLLTPHWRFITPTKNLLKTSREPSTGEKSHLPQRCLFYWFSHFRYLSSS